MREVAGYDVEGSDGNVGQIDDFIADDVYWAIRYVVVATGKWLSGRKVLIAPRWLVEKIDWSTHTVKSLMSRDRIGDCPEFDPASPVNREYETRLYDYYGRPRYWE